VIPGRAAAEEAHRAAVDHLGRIERRRALHLAAEAELGVFVARVMPDFASRRLASTSWVLLPMDETMPIPVTTTRLIFVSTTRSATGSSRSDSRDRLRIPSCPLLSAFPV
jgi:hypothetical protein